MPDALASRPSLSQRWRHPLAIWEELAGSRPPSSTEGLAEIPFSEVFLYGFANGLSNFDSVELWKDVHKIDTVWVASTLKKHKAEPKKTAAPEKACL